MSSTKSAIGHLLGAAGAVEAIYTVLAIRDQVAPPTLNLENPSDGIEGIDLVPLAARKRPIRAALSNSFGFGGTNASLLFTQADCQGPPAGALASQARSAGQPGRAGRRACGGLGRGGLTRTGAGDPTAR